VRVARLWHSRSAVSPVIGVILMVAATIVIAAIVMGYLGGFNPPPKPTDIQLANGELYIVNRTGNHSWVYLRFTLGGADASVIDTDDEVRTNLIITIANSTEVGDVRLNDQNNVTVNASSTFIQIGVNTSVYDLPVVEDQQSKVVIKYKPTGQVLFDGVLIAKRVE